MELKKHVSLPNTLSVSRIILLPVLFILLYKADRIVFLIAYIIVGLTDAVDGFIAKRLNKQTDMGKLLDSYADLFFFFASVYFIYYYAPKVIEPYLFSLLGILLIRLVSMMLAYKKFKRPYMMHTVLLKFIAVVVYVLVIFVSLFDPAPLAKIAPIIVVVAYIAFFEELVIFLVSEKVDPDAKTVFSVIK